MKPFWKDVAAGLLMGFVLPGVFLNFAVLVLKQPQAATSASETVCFTVSDASETTESAALPMRMQLQRPDGTVEQMDMDDYLVGVVLAEMPAWFEEEALKAQAVVARTYTLKAYTTGGKHGNGSVCTQSGCCQAYISRDEYIRSGGTGENVEKVRRAVEETSDCVLVYQGDLIEATYFSCSGGSTEDAVAVWGTDYPYLRAVSSPGEEEAAHYSDTVYFETAHFCEALDISPEGSPAEWIGKPEYTPGGGVSRIPIGGKTFTGVQLRQLLGLRSTAISLSPGETGITVITKGFGHRVGMSQYGADAMAASGSSYPEILKHYYGGAELVEWTESENSSQ